MWANGELSNAVNMQDELLLNFHKQIKSVIQKFELWLLGTTRLLKL